MTRPKTGPQLLTRTARRGGALALAIVLAAASCGDAGGPPPQLAPPHQLIDVAEEVGITFRHGAFRWETSADPAAMMGGGVCWLDYDDDGWLDLYLVNTYSVAEWGRWQEAGGLPRNGLFHNERGRFEEVGEGSGADLAMRGNGCVAADFDGDGRTDLYVTSDRANALLWNEGGGRFREGAAAAGVDTPGWHSGAAAGDLNGDGRTDLFVAGYADPNTRRPGEEGSFPRSFTPVSDLLFVNEGPGPDGLPTFREVGATVGLEPAGAEYGLGVVFSDLDDDGDLDIYVANDTDPNRLYRNERWPGGAAADPEGLGFRLAEIAAAARVGDDNSGMGVAAADFDADGRFDLLVTNLDRQLHSVYRNEGGGGTLEFADAHASIGREFGVGTTGWGASWADFDLDRDLDLIVAAGRVPIVDPTLDAQPLRLYDNQAPGLDDRSHLWGLDAVGSVSGRGVAAADYDNDGDVDVAIGTIGGPALLLQNGGAEGNWLTVALEGVHPGARVEVRLDDGAASRCEVRAGGSYLSSEDPRCHFGLGAVAVATVEVRWPNGEITTLTGQDAGQVVRVVTGD